MPICGGGGTSPAGGAGLLGGIGAVHAASAPVSASVIREKMRQYIVEAFLMKGLAYASAGRRVVRF